MFYVPTWLGPWGYLPLTAPLVATLPARLGTRLAPRAGTIERWLVGAVVLAAVTTAALRLGAEVGVLSPYALFALFAALWLAGRSGASSLAVLRARSVVPVLVVATVGLGLVVGAAYLLPPWPWDSLGYHLPFVGFVLQDRSIHGVPESVPYLATYPHNIELTFVALRMLLPDDRLLDLGQLPFGLLGTLATAGIARRLGASSTHAIVAGLLWLTMPAVLLQLPTNYVDVGAASYLLCAIYFLVGPGTQRDQLLSALALGLFLGAKPSAPIGTALCGLLLVWRGRHDRGITALACVLVLVLGAEAYVTNLVRHHNPTWPVRVDVGPIHLPGTNTVADLLGSGAAAPHLTGHLRMLRSWLVMVPPPTFDMRMGGFGPPFVLALVPALLLLWQRRRSGLPLLALAALVAPDPAIARYTLALPGLVLALSAAWLVTERDTVHAGLALGMMAAFNVAVAWPGFAGEGPPLGGYLGLSWADREGAVGPDWQTAAIDRVRDRLQPGDVAACDGAFEFSYLLWRPDLANRVVRITTDAERDATIADEATKLLVVNDKLSLDRSRWQRLFHCESDACVVYTRR